MMNLINQLVSRFTQEAPNVIDLDKERFGRGKGLMLSPERELELAEYNAANIAAHRGQDSAQVALPHPTEPARLANLADVFNGPAPGAEQAIPAYEPGRRFYVDHDIGWMGGPDPSLDSNDPGNAYRKSPA